MVPTGFRFSPTDEELVDILKQKVSGNYIAMAHLDFIVESNIYELEPQDLQWTQSAAVNKNERYYYCKRKSDSREVSGRGWWKATSHVKAIFADGGLVGFKRPLTFHRFRDDQRKRKDAIKTEWIMHEYRLDSIPTEWRLCKIKYKGKEKLEEDMENIINTNPMSPEAGVCSSSMNPIQSDFAFEEPLQPPLSPNNDYENYFWSNSNMRMFDEQQQQLEFEQPSFSFDPSSSMSIPAPSYYHFDQQDNYEQPFPDLWSWLNWHRSL